MAVTLNDDQIENLLDIWNQIVSQREDIGDIYFMYQTPVAKFKNARNSYAQNLVRESMLLLYDSTFFGSAKLGFILSNEKLFYKNSDETPTGCIDVEKILDMTITESKELSVESVCSIRTSIGTEQIYCVSPVHGNFYILKAFVDYLKGSGNLTKANTDQPNAAKSGICKACNAHNPIHSGTCEYCESLM